jgi:midasin (ATPase involved in ribosome maturation)
LENYTEGQKEVNFLTMDLFESSDVVDLIGGFEMKGNNQEEDQTLFRISNEEQNDQVEEMKKTALFSWKESNLVKAIRNGHWILLRGIESVNSGVLERLNGILEKEEVIWLNEALGDSMEDKMLIKHAKFRVFLQYEEDKGVKTPSRALRNRCVEVRIDNFIKTDSGVDKDLKNNKKIE